MSDSGGHARWERSGAQRHDAAYDEARAALLLGQMVYDRRTALGLTQAELAARTGMTQPQLSRLATISRRSSSLGDSVRARGRR
jgi:hypothetical protein